MSTEPLSLRGQFCGVEDEGAWLFPSGKPLPCPRETCPQQTVIRTAAHCSWFPVVKGEERPFRHASAVSRGDPLMRLPERRRPKRETEGDNRRRLSALELRCRERSLCSILPVRPV